MPTDPDRRVVAKGVAVMLAGTWLLITLGLSFAPEVVAVPPYFLPFTALVFTIVGRLWGIERDEMESYLPGSLGSTTDSDQQNREQTQHQTQNRGRDQ